ncbi:Alpha/Beta hydrolase protein [Phakopsora pachyrhizi]|nr:Alpha/Beta hydrolase protein [Phakopsora pachyrhizi]
MKYRTQQERRSAKTVPDRLPGSLGHFSVPYQRLKLPVGFSDVNSVRSLLIAFGSRAFSLTTNLLKNQEHIGQPKFPCVEQNHACSVNLMRLRDGSHSSAQNEVPGVYGIGTDYGQSLSRFNLAYETWGILSSAKDNVILLHIALSASSNAKSHDLNKSFGWWEKFIGHGPNYPIDLNWYFVICTNVLGSCYGSTGPSSINPETNEPMGPISQSSQSLTRVGSSMGGMQSIVTAWLEPQRVQTLLLIIAIDPIVISSGRASQPLPSPTFNIFKRDFQAWNGWLKDYPQEELLKILARLLDWIMDVNNHLKRTRMAATPSSKLCCPRRIRRVKIRSNSLVKPQKSSLT